MGSQDEVMSLAAERRSERAGRTKAERQLRELQLEYGMVKERLERKSKTKITSSIEIEDDTENSCKGTWGPQHEEDGQALGAYPLRPIGILRSCYNNRNGTPRQPLLVSSARSYLELRPELANSGIFDGLAQYSHVWVIYIFNKNTDIHRLWQDDPYNGVRSKVRVPRLNGERLGVFATRSPHRPCPIGLSCARIVHIENNRIILAGLDVVDGSPILDIKPYASFCDSIKNAVCPPWVTTKSAENEPLEVTSVQISETAQKDLKACWQHHQAQSLYSDLDSLQNFIIETLSIDIRSVTQRIKVPKRIERGNGALPPLDQGPSEALVPAHEQGKWHVVLDAIELTYDMNEDNVVTVMSAKPLMLSNDE